MHWAMWCWPITGRSVFGVSLPVPVGAAEGQPYRPRLDRADVVFSEPFDAEKALSLPASSLTQQDPRKALPAVLLQSAEGNWNPRRDLLGADRFAQEFVVETEHGQTPGLRFGDDVQGRRPTAGSGLTAQYRVGGGPEGNIGADILNSVVTPPHRD